MASPEICDYLKALWENVEFIWIVWLGLLYLLLVFLDSPGTPKAPENIDHS